MSLISQHRSRVIPRQAVVLFFVEPADMAMANFAVPLFLDLLGILVSINGASLVVVTNTREGRRKIARVIPAGVELLTAPSDKPAIGWTIQQLIDKGFDRILVMASDVIGVPIRVVSTALSAIGSVGSIRGLSTREQSYLIGVQSNAAQSVAGVFDLATFDDGSLSGVLPPTRGIERFPRLIELKSPGELFELVSSDSRHFPHLFAEFGNGFDSFRHVTGNESSPDQ